MEKITLIGAIKLREYIEKHFPHRGSDFYAIILLSTTVEMFKKVECQ